MAEHNPLILYHTLRDTLRRYIPTTLPISRNYPELRKKFRELITQQDLVQCPYLEALPDFEKGIPLRSLLRSHGGFLNDEFASLPEHVLDRPLHQHQEIALRAACEQGESLLVATGTGSGKTETFLYPVAHRLLDQKNSTQPGVRCLLIYPMNALANDQLYYRIAPLFANQLAAAKISFGRFTSQIRANTDRHIEESRLTGNEKLMKILGERIPSHWKLTREEMLDEPPQILITNYAMLEHLLLLPRNAPLFSQNTLECIVLDEIHTYSGAQATEVAYLLRKLKNRLNLKRRLQVFGTSASLPEGEDNNRRILEFAKGIFDEPVDRIIRGRRIPHYRLTRPSENQFSLKTDTWIQIGRALESLGTIDNPDTNHWRDALAEQGIETPVLALHPDQKHFGTALESTFGHNQELRTTSEILSTGGVVSFEEVAERVFAAETHVPAEHRTTALSAVVHLGMMARAHADAFPLLPARYHLAVSGIEGVSVKLCAKSREGWADLKPLRVYNDETGQYFPLLVCRKCGQPYIEGFDQQGCLHNRRPSGEEQVRRHVFWLGLPPDIRTADEEDQEENEASDSRFRQRMIDPQTGRPPVTGSATVSLYEIDTEETPEERTNYVTKCPACGGRSAGADAEIITRMHPGNEALASVVVQQVLDALPPRQESYDPLPMMGRTLLTFSDNRQNAAFFAPYFERTSGELAIRSAIYHALHDNKEPCDLALLSEEVFKIWKRFGQPILIDENGETLENLSGMRDRLMGRIAAEFCTSGGRRNSLEALGLVRISWESNRFHQLLREIISAIPERLRNQAESLMRFLLETIRREKAITHLWDVDLTSEYIWGNIYSKHRSFLLHKSNTSNGWLPPEGTERHNRRTYYLVKRLGWEREEALRFLTQVWEILRNKCRLLIPHQPGFGLDGKLMRFANAADHPLFVCDACGLLQSDVVNNCCTAFRCEGKVHQLTDEERTLMAKENHYIHLYQNGRTMTTRAQEHTAALSTELREKIEQEFSKGKVNILSCTTTMEMGVDLGELDAVVNLNIPPGIANYQQRTGRAGRRAQAAPFCVTIARNSQYDQAQYRQFQKYLRGTAPVPFLLLDNAQLFERHQLGIVLSHLLRQRITNLTTNAPSLANFFGASFDKEALNKFKDEIDRWLDEDAGHRALDESERLAGRLPPEKQEIAVRRTALKNLVYERITDFAEDIQERWQRYSEKIDELAKGGNDTKSLQQRARWSRMRDRYMQQFLVEHLSQRSLIPTYSFPVHTLTLEVIREYGHQNFWGNEGDISLSRDAMLGISEYAPGAEVVANGRIWTSAGLASYPRAFVPQEWYAACLKCHHVDTAIAKDDLPHACSHCGTTITGIQKRSYLRPRGFVTAYEGRKGNDPGTTRRRERPVDEARLLTLPLEDQYHDTDHPRIRFALLRARSFNGEGTDGRMFIVNRGPYRHGYHICPRCNFATPAKKHYDKINHKEPLHEKHCLNKEKIYAQDLAHEFNTDVVLLRFDAPIPSPDQAEADPRNQWMERFARTLAETLRFTSAKVLEIQATELRATFKLRAQTIEVVLYDAVAGGAGYCVRLAELVSMKQLIADAVRNLNCPLECANACTACLCDYGNQNYWDQLDRKPVQRWLTTLRDEVSEDIYPNLGLQRWHEPSLAALSRTLKSAPEIHFIASRFVGEMQKEQINWLLDLLNAGIRLHVHLLESPVTTAASATLPQLQALRYLAPYLEDERLTIDQFLDIESIDLMQLPRIATGATEKARAWFSLLTGVPLLQKILPEPIYRGDLPESVGQVLREFISNAKSIPKNAFRPALPLQRWELNVGDPRDLESWFQPVIGQEINKITIKDPYCGQSEALIELVRWLVTSAKKIDELAVHAKELHKRDPGYRARHLVINSLRNSLKEIFSGNLQVLVHEFVKSSSFHDRTIDITLVDVNGIKNEYRYDLSGGIDYLLDQDKSTKIFCYSVER